jgi:hypothetical protein
MRQAKKLVTWNLSAITTVRRTFASKPTVSHSKYKFPNNKPSKIPSPLTSADGNLLLHAAHMHAQAWPAGAEANPHHTPYIHQGSSGRRCRHSRPAATFHNL